ncbi:phage portal protein [Sporosarcina sp. P33]|uniref:phage portal protein n=1 Tax=Sporosarcina sp. P33 TaxID=1930764 RepID=UPI0009C03A93|nr:phage portal protein [Sporosarcina sp. P33]ARD47583.1 portal protein [Sporosarcina sp. P33]
MNLVDKVVNYFNPAAGVKRAAHREARSIITNGYSQHGASTGKNSTRGWQVFSGSAKEDIDAHNKTLRERSRDLYMSGGIATGAIKTLNTNVVGSGLRLNPQIDYEFLGMTLEQAGEWKRNVKREFDLWADSINCDATRVNNFYELQQLAFLSQLMSGDAFVTLPVKKRVGSPYELCIQLIEADRCSTPTDKWGSDDIVNGVETDEYGEVVAFHFAKHHPGSAMFMLTNQWTRMERFGSITGRPNVLHLMEMERPEQRRGVPMLTPVIEQLKQLTRYSDAELMAAVINGMYAIFIESENESVPGSDLGGIDQSQQQDLGEEYDNDIQIGNGAVNFLNPGEKMAETKVGRPNTAFDGFVTSICRQVGAALEIPYEILLKHFTSSYSASRAALLEAWKMYRKKRDGLATDFCQPVFEEWLAEAVAKGRVKAPGFFSDPSIRKAYSRAEWNGPSQGQLNPVQEVRASIMKVENGFSTREKETVELSGGSYDSNHRTLVAEERARRKEGLSKPLDDEARDLEGGEEIK